MPKKKSENDIALETLHLVAQRKDAVEYMQVLLAAQGQESRWGGYDAIPPASLVEKIVNLFKETTDIPLELPMFLTLHYIAGWLLYQNVTIKFAGMSLRPDFWSVILGPSGAGKTFTADYLNTVFGGLGIPMMPSTKSGAQFVDELECHNKGLMIRDEWGQYVKEIESKTGPQVDMRDILLNLYGGGKIERRTKTYQTVIPDAALSIIGLTVGETFLDQISLESIVDGFGQRFSYVYADADPERPMEDYPIYTTYEKSQRQIMNELNKIAGKINEGDEFKVSRKGLAKFEEIFRSFASNTKLPASFFRRALFRAVQYALVYHVLLKKRSKTLDDTDIAWGARLVALHLRDAGRLLQGHGLSKIERWCRRAEEIRERCKKSGKEFTIREVTRGINAIDYAYQARDVMKMIGEDC